eukprot:12713767-Ditylum_brightwellii.AAC.1
MLEHANNTKVMKDMMKNKDGPEKEYVLDDYSKRPESTYAHIMFEYCKNTHEKGLEFAVLPDFGGWVSENWLAFGRIL